VEETPAVREQTEADGRESTSKERMEVTNEKILKETLNETGDKIRGYVNINSEICFHQINTIKL
jgi:hypothetical protein